MDKLAKKLSKAKGIIIIHCRLTAPKDYSKKREEQDLEADKYVRSKIEDISMDKGFFYKKIPYRHSGTIECIISNYPFESFSPFTSETVYGTSDSDIDNDMSETLETSSEPNIETTNEEIPTDITTDVEINDLSTLTKTSKKSQNPVKALFKQAEMKITRLVNRIRK